jgi:Clp amino terminal domain, pathogenicity island component
VIALEVADLVVIAGRTLGLDTGRVLDLLDPAVAERALTEARPDSQPGDPASQGATLLHAIVRHRPLRHGNKQVALAAMLQFLALNGWGVDPDPAGHVATMVAELAAGTLDTKDLADWLAPRLRPSDRGATVAKEAPMRPRPAPPLAERIKMATLRTRREGTRRKGMFRRFTNPARRAVVLARDEARDLGHGFIGPEHLLLGLLREGESVAAMVLESLGISLRDARGQVEEITGHGQGTRTGHIPFTLHARTALELSLREALQLGHNWIGTEHLLLALLRDGEGVPARVLTGLGAGHPQVREGVLNLQASLRREQQWAAGADVGAVIAENRRVHRELDRLRDLLRQHGIEPDGGTARTA